MFGFWLFFFLSEGQLTHKVAFSQVYNVVILQLFYVRLTTSVATRGHCSTVWPYHWLCSQHCTCPPWDLLRNWKPVPLTRLQFCPSPALAIITIYGFVFAFVCLFLDSICKWKSMVVAIFWLTSLSITSRVHPRYWTWQDFLPSYGWSIRHSIYTTASLSVCL